MYVHVRASLSLCGRYLNGGIAPYREWPHAGLYKFKDIMTALEEHIKHADYFFFMVSRIGISCAARLAIHCASIFRKSILRTRVNRTFHLSPLLFRTCLTLWWCGGRQDADVRFMERVELVDIGADLMGVEHPMYPRYEYGWCKPGDPNTRGFCQFPYDRNKKSNAFIPDGHGRSAKQQLLHCTEHTSTQ